MLSLSLFLFLTALADAQGSRVIVKLSDNSSVDTKLGDLNIRSDAVVKKLDNPIFKGFALNVTDEEVKAIEADPDVEYVKEDLKMNVPPLEDDGPIKTLSNVPISPDEDQTEYLFNWGLDRIDSRSGTDSRYVYDWTGLGVDIYIVDSGVFAEHNDFQGRVSSDCFTAYPSEGCIDFGGHGSHVAGIAAGLFSGVAKEAVIINVKVFDLFGGGYVSDTIEGLGWIVERHLGRGSPPAVINMSLGSVFIAEYNDIVTDVIGNGLVVAAAAGNDYAADSCARSPASTPDAITVASSNIVDFRSDFSNVGRCVDIFAPGSEIYSSSHYLADIVVSKSGTSMACPHVAGAAALYLQANPSWTPADVRDAMIADATSGVLTDTRDSPNLLLFTGDIGAEPTPPAPLLCGCRLIQLLCVFRCLFGLDE